MKRKKSPSFEDYPQALRDWYRPAWYYIAQYFRIDAKNYPGRDANACEWDLGLHSHTVHRLLSNSSHNLSHLALVCEWVEKVTGSPAPKPLDTTDDPVL